MSKRRLALAVPGLLILMATLQVNSAGNMIWGKSLQGTVTVTAGTQNIPALLSLTPLSFSGAQPNHANGVLIAVYEPRSQQFWWSYQDTTGSPDLTSIKNDIVENYRLLLDGSRIARLFT